MFQVTVLKERSAIVSISFIKAYAIKYVTTTIILICIVLTYELFSNGVTSLMMRLSVFLPLIYGLILLSLKTFLPYKRWTRQWLMMSMVTLMTGMFLFGVFEIYGNQNIFVPYIFYVGYGLLGCSFFSIIVEGRTSE